jgi:branched-chain amino acid transport system ATP-binding protein
MSILEVEKLNKTFGGLIAVRDFDMSVEKGEIVGLIGPNGAGKTTLFNMP